MPRFAIGDLTIDLDIPARFACEYSLNGSLITHDKQSGTTAEISALHLNRDGVAALRENAAEAKCALNRDSAEFASFFKPPKTWFAGFGRHLIIATLTKGEIPEFADVLASVGPAHDPFPPDEETAFSDLRPSHTRWFEQRRTSLLDAISWSSERHDAAERLDDFWAELLENPPDDQHLLATMLSGLTLGFGDLLKRHGFAWCVAKDPWGTSIAMVALRGTANMLLVPESFVAKRWESRAPRFIANAVHEIGESVQNAKAEWARRPVN